MLCRGMLLGVLMLGGLVAFPPVARAQIACGASITTNTDLTGDLDCSNYRYDPIHINADNVTFKLNGYTLTCSSQWGWYNTPYEDDVEGIRATGRTGVKILGPGKITNCGRAVTFEGGSNNTVQGVYMAGNLGGITFIGGANSTARDNVIVRNLLAGIGTSGSANIQILGNYIAANGGYDPAVFVSAGFGITNDNASTVTIANNAILGNEHGGIGEFGASALAAQITNNIILGNGGADLSLRGTDDVVTGSICETSTPPGLCPYPLPRFPTVSLPTPTAVGVFRPSDGTFYLDKNKSGTWDGCGTDSCLQIGQTGDVPLVGDWTGDGTSKIGVFRPSDGTFYLDYNGSGTWEGCGTDRCLRFGLNGDIPLVGDWNGSGTSKVGAFRPGDGTFYLDYNGNGTWDGCGTDRCLQIGLDGDIPLVGTW